MEIRVTHPEFKPWTERLRIWLALGFAKMLRVPLRYSHDTNWKRKYGVAATKPESGE